MRRLIVIFLISILCSCAHKGAVPEQQPEKVYPGPSEPCDSVYTYAPGNFIVDVSAGSEVALDPVIQEFPIFCSPAAARQGLNSAISGGKIPKGDWKIYRLQGTYQEIGRAVGPGRYILGRPTLMADWVKD